MPLKVIEQALDAWPGSLRSLARAAGLAHTTLLRIQTGGIEASALVIGQIADALELASVDCRRAARQLRRSLARRKP